MTGLLAEEKGRNPRLFEDGITTEQVRRILQLEPGERRHANDPTSDQLSMYDKQVRGIATLYNILREQPVAYLADEVGMGKTYQALGLATLLWNLDPDARVMVVAPRGNVQRKWAADYYTFLRNNYRQRDDRVVDALLGRPVREPLACENLTHLVGELVRDPGRLFVLRHTSFMRPVVFSAGQTHAQKIIERKWEELQALHFHAAGEVIERLRTTTVAHDEAKQACMAWTCAAVRQALPEVDLLIVDEAQCLRHRDNQSNTNFRRVFGLHQSDEERRTEQERFLDRRTYRGLATGAKVKRLLLLSATPAHSRVEDIASQLRYGLGLQHGNNLRDVIDQLERAGSDLDSASRALQRVMLRRFRMFGPLNKYGYRQERAPAMRVEEDPLAELSTALVTKHLYRALQGNGHRFRVGFLSSFESLQESIRAQRPDDEEDDGGGANEGTHTEEAGRPPDDHFIARLNESFRHTFGMPLVHPKQRYIADEARRLLDPKATPDLVKMLVFVRRIATVHELVREVSAVYDDLLGQRLAPLFEIAEQEISPSRVEARLQEMRRGIPDEPANAGGSTTGAEDDDGDAPEDAADSDGKSEYLGLFRKRGSAGQWFRRLFNQQRALWWFFDENWVRTLWWLETEGATPLATYLSERGVPGVDGKASYPASHEAFYRSQLRFLRERRAGATGDVSGVQAFLRRRLARHVGEADRTTWQTSDGKLLMRTSFWNELLERGTSGYASFLRFSPSSIEESDLYQREQIKAWISKNLRMSEPIFDLAAAFRASRGERETMVRRFADNVAAQPKLLRRLELLASCALLIDRTLGYDQQADRYDRLDGWALFDDQSTVRGVLGGSGSRDVVTRQFNTPFFPDVIVCTDVLREGVDLHLFCDRVVHYGLAFSPGDIEQRTGRVDRYFSKAYRAIEASANHRGRVHVEFPYVASTLDELQLARVLARRNSVQELMDRGLPVPRFDPEMSTRERADPIVALLLEPSSERREDPFPGSEGGGLTEVHVAQDDDWHDIARTHIDRLLDAFCGRFHLAGTVDRYLEGRLDHRLFRLTVGLRGRGAEKRLAFAGEQPERVQTVQMTLDFVGSYRTHVLRARSWITDDGSRQELEKWVTDLAESPAMPYATGVAVLREHRKASRRAVINALVAEAAIPFTRQREECTVHAEELADLIGRVACTADHYEEQLHERDREPQPSWR